MSLRERLELLSAINYQFNGNSNSFIYLTIAKAINKSDPGSAGGHHLTLEIHIFRNTDIYDGFALIPQYYLKGKSMSMSSFQYIH